MNKKILVTGGAGFLGSHLCRALLKNENQVICLDDLSTGKIENIKELFCNKNFTFVERDITKPYMGKIDEIYNLASPASPLSYQKEPLKTIKTNFYGALNMLEMARITGAKILQASTSEVYGNPQIHPQTENYYGYVNPIGIRACYDEGKRIAETMFFDYYREYGVKIKVVRIFNTYGPHMNKDDGRVISNFVRNAISNIDIAVNGNGNQTRSFCYVEDMVQGLQQMMQSSEDMTGPINLGNPQEITIKELAQTIIDLTKSKSKIYYTELPSDDPERRRPDITLANQKLNWYPKVSLESGLIRTIEYIKGKYQKVLPR